VQRQTGSVPPVIDADDVLRDPERMLRLLCSAIGVDLSTPCVEATRPAEDGWPVGKDWYAKCNARVVRAV